MKWSEVTKQDLAPLLKTMSGVEIGMQYGIGRSAVYKKLAKLGLKPKYRNTLFMPPRDELAKLYKQMSMKAIAHHYGVGETVIFKRVKQYGLKFISRSERLTGKPKSKEHCDNMRKARLASGQSSGENNGNWKGGITPQLLRLRASSEYKLWKAAVREQANYRCESCDVEHDGNKIILHSHHIKPFSQFPELRFDLDNGMALCKPCHKEIHLNTP